MNESAPGLYSLPHAVFLRRLAGATRGTSLDARLGRAAFVALRLIDLLGPDEHLPTPDAFHYQYAATERACRGLPADRPETSHLIGVVQSTADAYHTSDVGLLFPALFAYAHYLEDEMCLEEALDVLETLERVGGDRYRAEDRVAARLRVARVLRKVNRFDEAERAYEEAGAQAEPIGDSHSQLLSRIGRAESLRGRGNLPDAERWLRTILADADAIGDAEAHALGHHVLAAVLSTAGRSAEAIPHMWRAFESYEDATSRGRALADLGALFLILGNSEDAERALTEAVRRGGAQDFATNALIELMNCASFRRDRVGFERWREECEKRRETMPPNVLVDFMLKMGIGRARFEQFDRAQALLARALQTAESAGLHEFVFRIERVKNGLRECQPTEVVETPEPQTEAVREVSASLARLEV
ncbi:MAG TPA: tetratricopeptide repeat protein [Gemmatimonadales bacterium]